MRSVAPTTNFALAVPDAHSVPSQLWSNVELLSLAGRVTVAVEAVGLPGLVCEISYFHSVTLKPTAPEGGSMEIVAWLPRVGGAGFTARLAVGLAAPLGLISFSSARSVTAPSRWSFDQIHPPLVLVALLVCAPTANTQRSPPTAAAPSLVTWILMCGATVIVWLPLTRTVVPCDKLGGGLRGVAEVTTR